MNGFADIDVHMLVNITGGWVPPEALSARLGYRFQTNDVGFSGLESRHARSNGEYWEGKFQVRDGPLRPFSGVVRFNGSVVGLKTPPL